MKPQTTRGVLDSDTHAQSKAPIIQSLNAKSLRDLPEDSPLEILPRSEIYLILDNVYDTYNIGGLFRLADAMACSRICLCGVSETPPNARILKASIGTYKVVPWSYHTSALEAVETLCDAVDDLFVVAIEQAESSIPYAEIAYRRPLALIVGSETHGVSPEALSMCNAIAEIPMLGYNKSLNVIVSAGIVGFHAVNFLDRLT